MTEVRRLLGRLPASAPQAGDLVELVEGARLRGRGGAAFPVARKLRTAQQARGRPVVVVNAAEGEPASSKDRTLLATDPALVVEGARAVARALRAVEVVVAAHDPRLVRGLGVRVVELQPGYVRSEASAVVSAVTGGRGLPTARRRPQAERGPGGRPWVVQNVETFGCIGLLVRHGLDWYQQVGTADEPGTRLLTVTGAVHRPGVVELPVGAPLRAALQATGGATRPLQALLVGGYAGRWLAPEHLDLPLTVDGIRAVGGTLGAGLVVALPDTACGLATTARVVRYLASQSARQCGPCTNGLPAVAGAVEELAAGRPGPGVLDRLSRWCGLVTGRGACSHPDGAVALVRSALETFADDVQQHLTGDCGRSGLDVGVPA